MTQLVQSVDRALRLMWCVHAQPGISLTELSETVGLLPSTALRLLATLKVHGMVDQDPETRGYRIGTGARALNQDSSQRSAIIAARLEPVVRRLADTVHEQASVAVLTGRTAQHILTNDGARRAGYEVILRSDNGRTDANLNATALGKILLAYAPAPVADDIIANLSFERTGSRTITTPDELRRHLRQVRRHRIAFSIAENTEHVAGVAAPVLTADRQYCIAAVAVHGPVTRLPPKRLRELAPAVQAAGEDASQLLDPGIEPDRR